MGTRLAGAGIFKAVAQVQVGSIKHAFSQTAFQRVTHRWYDAFTTDELIALAQIAQMQYKSSQPVAGALPKQISSRLISHWSWH